MRLEELRQVHQARPFCPFTLQLADGDRVGVPHPEFLMFSRSGRTLFVATEDDSFKVIDLLLVVAVDVGNGRVRRSRGRSR